MLAPIPGMSLTKEPRNQPWEQPPKFSRKEEVLAFYLERLNDPDVLDDFLFMLDRKIPLEIVIEALTSYGVMEGYHSPDLKVLVSPILHEHLRMLCEAIDLEIVEWAGPSNEEKKSEKDKTRMKILIQEALDNPTPPEPEMVKEAGEALQGDKQPLIRKRNNE